MVLSELAFIAVYVMSAHHSANPRYFAFAMIKLASMNGNCDDFP